MVSPQDFTGKISLRFDLDLSSAFVALTFRSHPYHKQYTYMTFLSSRKFVVTNLFSSVLLQIPLEAQVIICIFTLQTLRVNSLKKRMCASCVAI